jgi:cell division protein ZapE
MRDSKVACAYEALVAEGAIIDDAAQRQAIAALDTFGARIAHALAAKSRLRQMLGLHPRKGMGEGVYLTGRVGRGKTMLMDLFFKTVKTAKKRRVHHGEFMEEIHGRIHALRAGKHGADAIATVAEGVAEEARLLCLDEFQVNDITDAMLLARLFKAVMQRGTFVVFSTNTEPDKLYENGLNRQLFLPFIAFIKQRFTIIELSGGTDYRLRRIAGEEAYITPLGERADQHIERLWQKLTDGEPGRGSELMVNGRVLRVPRAAHGAARFQFAELCEEALGTADYLALARLFDTLFVENVPLLNGKRRDARRRMITLIDTLYDGQIRLAMSAAAAPEALAPGESDFERTASRLRHMQSAEYWQHEGKDN